MPGWLLLKFQCTHRGLFLTISSENGESLCTFLSKMECCINKTLSKKPPLSAKSLFCTWNFPTNTLRMMMLQTFRLVLKRGSKCCFLGCQPHKKGFQTFDLFLTLLCDGSINSLCWIEGGKYKISHTWH